ncbi:MAG: acyloxyacyl hydrolase, partial [Prevotellaceae bacterium]|nr:acyloxyacyl hydrolase [Prevotellaceae bacterium]
GNPQILGQAFAVYPYLLVPVVSRGIFQLNYKVGAGVSFFTKTWNRCDTIHGINAATANSAIGSVMNIYLNTGANFEFLLTENVSITADVGYSHMSNGSVLTPNQGINIIYGQIGAKCYFKRAPYTNFYKNPAYELPYDFCANITASGGLRELYYSENKIYPAASIHAGLTFKLTNWYALGGGIDAFYDGVFDKRPHILGEKNQPNNPVYGRYKIDNDDLINKFRGGISINNEFIIGKVTALLDWGIYVFDPIRNAYPEPHLKYGDKRPMFYSYDIEKEDGWNYFRLGVRYRIWDNIFVSAAVKTHLQKAEMIEFGVGYLLPFAKVNKYGSMKRDPKGYYLYHFTQKEATEYPTIWR